MSEAHMKQKQKELYLGRQPILDIKQEIIGYELLFRSSNVNKSTYDSQDKASASVIAHALANFGLQEVLGNKDGYINVTEEVLLSETIELLPREQTVLELLETMPLNERNLERAVALKAAGFRLALDDHTYSHQNAAFYELVDIIKINLLETPNEILREMVEELRRYPVILLAECVETVEQFEECRDLGFQLFQGYFFARPAVLKRHAPDISTTGMIKLLASLYEEMDTDEIETVFRSYPDLSYCLIKLVNSVNIGLREKIKNLRHAIMILGRDKLRRWALLAIYASSGSGGINSPLMEMAAVRGRCMEYLIMQRYAISRGDDIVEAAFMTGIMSLMDVLFETSMEQILQELNLSDVITAALLNREGELGDLLALAEMLEMVNFGEVQALVEATDIPLANLLEAQLDAYKWRTGMIAEEEQSHS
ncbi:MAG: EAL domain-containing protein [Desulfuromonadaceae bacterium]|nr:EAL domain-containing protein [Desulfuromonadaceae bacterium]